MTQDDPADLDPIPANEQPTRAAVMEVKLGPDKAARGSVPPEHAPQLIATFGIVGCVISGITGLVMTLQIATALAVPAYAGLGLAFAGAGAVLIALCRVAARQARPRRPDHDRTR